MAFVDVFQFLPAFNRMVPASFPATAFMFDWLVCAWDVAQSLACCDAFAL